MRPSQGTTRDGLPLPRGQREHEPGTCTRFALDLEVPEANDGPAGLGGFAGGTSFDTRRRHLDRVLRIYIQHYNRERPHRGLALQPPFAPRLKLRPGGDVQRRDRLGGLVHEYYRAAA